MPKLLPKLLQNFCLNDTVSPIPMKRPLNKGNGILLDYSAGSVLIAPLVVSDGTYLNCRNLKSHSDGVNVLEFSDDGQFFAFGGRDTRVLWGSTGDENRAPAVMERKHSSTVSSLAISADNKRVYSAELNRNCLGNCVFIHDTTT